MPYPCFNTGCRNATHQPPRNVEGCKTFLYATTEWCVKNKYQIRPGVRAFAWSLGNTDDTRDLSFFYHCGRCSVWGTYWQGHPYWKKMDASVRDIAGAADTATVPQPGSQLDPVAYLRAGCPENPLEDTVPQQENAKSMDTVKTLPEDPQEDTTPPQEETKDTVPPPEPAGANGVDTPAQSGDTPMIRPGEVTDTELETDTEAELHTDTVDTHLTTPQPETPQRYDDVYEVMQFGTRVGYTWYGKQIVFQEYPVHREDDWHASQEGKESRSSDTSSYDTFPPSNPDTQESQRRNTHKELVSGRMPGDRVRNIFADPVLAWAVLEGMGDTPVTREMKRSEDLDTSTTANPVASTPKVSPFAQESEAEQNTREVVDNLRLRRAMDNMTDPYLLDKVIEAQNTAEDTPADPALSPRNTPTKRMLEDTLATAQRALVKANKLEAENEALRMVVFDLAYTVSAQQDRLCEQYTMYGRLSARVDKKEMEEYFAQVPAQKDMHTRKKKGPYLFPTAESIQEVQEDDQLKYLEEGHPDTAEEADTMAPRADTSSSSSSMPSFTAGTLISLPNEDKSEAGAVHTTEKVE